MQGSTHHTFVGVLRGGGVRSKPKFHAQLVHTPADLSPVLDVPGSADGHVEMPEVLHVRRHKGRVTL